MATTGTLVEWLASGVTTTAGAAVASGKVRFYQPGTLTPQSVYSDSACTSAITQPITLSAGGTAIVYTNASVRMIVKDSTDTSTLFDVVENVQRDDNTFVTSPSFNSGNETALATILDGWNTTGGGGTGSAGPFDYKASATATGRALKSWMAEVHISVKDFGAVGDGANNDTTAIQAAITAVGAAGGGIVYFPPGTYLINAALTITSTAVSLIGAGQQATILKNSGGATNAITYTSCFGFEVSGFQITHATSGTAAAIQLASCVGAAYSVIRNLGVTGHRTCVNLTGTTGVVKIGDSAFTAPNSNSAERGISLGSNGADIWVTDNYINGGQGMGIELVSGCQSVLIVNNAIGGVTNGIGFNAGFTGSNVTIRDNEMSSINAFSHGPATMGSSIDIWPNHGVEGYTTNVAIGGNVTPTLTKGKTIRIVANSGGAGTVTVNAPTPTPSSTNRDLRITIKYVNASGGVVTWSTNAVFVHVGATGPAGTDLHTIAVTYDWDPDASKWREATGRTDTLT